MKTTLQLKNLDEISFIEFAEKIAKNIIFPCVIYLQGDLGAGKSLFSRSLIHALGYQGTVKSPTYTLLESYNFNHQCYYHLDLYRLESAIEVEELGLRELQQGNFLFLIEWPEKGENYLPKPDLYCYIDIVANELRTITCQAHSKIGKNILFRLKEE